MTAIDLGPASRHVADLVSSVSDDQLDAPTPCSEYSLGDLVDHVGGLSLAFTGAATKETGAATAQGGSGDASRLGADWRARVPRDLAGLAAAWRDPTAWTGMTRAGGVELPGEVAGIVALDELILHGWDIARASGQAYEPDPAALEAVHGFLAQLATPEQAATRDAIFGPVVPIPDGAPLLDQVLGLAGRDPAWTSPV
jgi:uncharacterized protein (TIGR03086 family)